MKRIPFIIECIFNRIRQHVSPLVRFVDVSEESNRVSTTRGLPAAPTVDDALAEYEKRKARIFNQLNFLQLITGSIVPLAGLFYASKFTFGVWLIMCLPSITNAVVLLLNARQRFQAAFFCYFIFYPVVTCIVYLNGINTGYELSFVLYGILSIFFLRHMGYMLFALNLSMISYFVLFILWKQYSFQLEPVNSMLYLVSQALAIGYIFFALYLIKRENNGYQMQMLATNKKLAEINEEIERQRKEISEKATLLDQQTATLAESNSIKNKLFSIISHDLKGPVVALRDVFRHVSDKNLSAEAIKSIMPAILDDLNGSSELIENLLQWAKHQMQENSVRRQLLNVDHLINEIIRSLHLQVSAKQIRVEARSVVPVHAYADKDMISLVLRNLLSNAIKFTPEEGHIIICAYESPYCTEIYVQDSGRGITREEIKKISSDTFYTTRGTKNESGTGLGLMLCREFIFKNDGCLMIESEPGRGSRFSFTLPLASDAINESHAL